MARRKPNNKKPKPRNVTPSVGPTPELEAKGTERIGMAARRVPVIETMLKRDQITEDQYRRLSKLRDTMLLAERSPVKSCLNDNPGTSGDGPGAAIVSAIIQVGWWQREMPPGPWEVAQAVCRDDLSLTEYCVQKFGGRERYNGEGDFIAIVPVNEKSRLAEALLNLRYAAGHIVA